MLFHLLFSNFLCRHSTGFAPSYENQQKKSISILSNGDLILCRVDFEGKTRIGNLHTASLLEILSSEELGKIINGFKHFKLVHPHCRQCLGSTSFASWVFKPILSIAALNVLKPFFYKRTRLYP